jgi:hypothetical protein
LGCVTDGTAALDKEGRRMDKKAKVPKKAKAGTASKSAGKDTAKK